MMTYSERKEYQQAMIQFCFQQRPEYLVTLALHNPYPEQIGAAERQMWHFDAMLDRALLGPTWAKAPVDSRTLILAIPEGRRCGAGYYDLHYHLALRPARSRQISETEGLLHKVTMAFKAKCLPSGSVDFQKLQSNPLLSKTGQGCDVDC
jgi:hypothetical protein